MNAAEPFPTIIQLSTGKSLRGGERQVILLHKGLLARGRKSVLMCRARSELSRQTIPALMPVPWAGEWDVLGLRRLLGQCKSPGASIIHCHDAHALSHGSVIGATLGIPVVYTRRVVFPLHSDLFSKWKYRQCRMLIAISNAVAAQCREVVAEQNIRVIPDCADWTRSIVSRSEARKALNIPEKCFIIASVGHFTREKNFPLIRALASALQKTKPEIRLICIGPIDDQCGPVPENLVCTGLIPDAINFYNAFDMYVSTSTQEGLGSALLDAVVRDIPSVATDGGGTRDIFPDTWPRIAPSDEPGFIKAVQGLIDNYEDAVSQAHRCGNRARGIFSKDSVIEKTIKVYDETARH